MSRLATSFVLGYHGCDQSVAQRAVGGEIDLLHSDKDHDWLGPGSYFWESDPRRAYEWALECRTRGTVRQPAVVGAVIDLRNCLDLANRDDLELLKAAHKSFKRLQTDSGLPMPTNRPLKGRKQGDLHLRYLDCAVIRHLHSIIAERAQGGSSRIGPYQTVRGPFPEGGRLFRGSGVAAQSHVQIAVLDDSCIKGIFLPRPDPAAATEFAA